MTELRNLAGKTGQARAALDHAGRPVLSVPVVALVGDLVIHAVNSAHAELVPISTLSRAPHEWAQKPVVLGHPKNASGQQISANSPAVLERHAFGTVSNPRVEKNKLCVDALIDEARAEKLGGPKFLEALRTGVPPTEVSVGCFVHTVDRMGEQGGRKFSAVWENLQPDHLAFLADSELLGVRASAGACNLNDGCGTHRAASSGRRGPDPYIGTRGKEQRRLEAAFDKDATMESRTLAQRLLGLLKFRGTATSFTEVQDALGDALRKVVPNFLCVDSVYTDDTVVYMVGSPLGGTPDDMTLMRRSFTAAKDGTVTLADDAEEVEAVTTYEPLNAEARAAAGARNSAPDLAKIQTVHDNAVALGATCAAGNVRVLAPKVQDCELCDGTGQVDSADCKACDGTGEVPVRAASDGEVPLKAAEAEDNVAGATQSGDKDAAGDGGKEDAMKVEERAAAIKALTECPCSGLTADHLKMLEAATNEQLVAFAERGKQIKADQDALKVNQDALRVNQDALKASQDRVVALEADLKAAADGDCPTCKGTGKMFGKDCADCGGTGKIGGKKEPKAAEAAKPMTAEEFLKVAPEEIRSLVARQKKADAAQKSALVGALKTAQDAYSETELLAMPVDELSKLARAVKVEAPDFSGRGLPRTAENVDVYAQPPDGYALAIAAQKQ